MRLSLFKLLLISVGIEVAAAVRGMDFIDKINLTVALSKLILCVNEDKSLLLSDFLTACEELAGVVLHYCIVFCAYYALCDNLFFRDVHIVAFVRFCSRSDYWFGESLILAHPIGELNSANLTASVLVIAPCRAGKDATDNHFHTETFAFQTYRNHRVGCG